MNEQQGIEGHSPEREGNMTAPQEHGNLYSLLLTEDVEYMHEDMDSSSFCEADLFEKPYCFPSKLHRMLDDCEQNGNERIVSWLPSGRAFRVFKRDEFLKTICPKYFQQTKFKSFQRQLNLYGFESLDTKRNTGASCKLFISAVIAIVLLC
jgi:hypothetical protein